MDIFKNVVQKGVFETIQPLPKQPGEIKAESRKGFEISYDQFPLYLADEQKQIELQKSGVFQFTVYDESFITSDSEIKLRIQFLKKINQLSIGKIDFRLSDNTLPYYINILNRIGWRHQNKTSFYMDIDRHPTQITNLGFGPIKGKIELPEEKLIYVDRQKIEQMIHEGIIDPQVGQDTIQLQGFVRSYAKMLQRQYHFDQLTSLDQSYLAYCYIKQHISYAIEQTYTDSNGILCLKASPTKWESRPYGTLYHQRGVCEGQAKLMSIMINNPYIKVNAVPIGGFDESGAGHCWVGVCIANRLFYCCTTKGGFMQLQPLREYRLDIGEVYPQIYPKWALGNNARAQIRAHVRSLRK